MNSKLILIFACTIALLGSCRSQRTLTSDKFKDKLAVAMRDKDLSYLSSAFAPRVFFQFVVVQDQFSDADYKNLKDKNGILYRLLFDDEFVRNRTGYSSAFRTAIVDGGHLSVSIPSSRAEGFPSITAAYNNAFYDLFLNCGAPPQCEIIGLNISGASGVTDLVLSVLPQQGLQYMRLPSDPAVDLRRREFEDGVPFLRISKPGRIEAYGPSRPFQVVYAGNENGYGGVAYALTDRGLLLFHHLTGISADIMNGARQRSKLASGTFVGENTQKIGIHKNDESPKITVEGRTTFGNLMYQETLMAVLQGK